jgi:hypothetical protein
MANRTFFNVRTWNRREKHIGMNVFRKPGRNNKSEADKLEFNVYVGLHK